MYGSSAPSEGFPIVKCQSKVRDICILDLKSLGRDQNPCVI